MSRLVLTSQPMPPLDTSSPTHIPNPHPQPTSLTLPLPLPLTLTLTLTLTLSPWSCRPTLTVVTACSRVGSNGCLLRDGTVTRFLHTGAGLQEVTIRLRLRLRL